MSLFAQLENSFLHMYPLQNSFHSMIVQLLLSVIFLIFTNNIRYFNTFCRQIFYALSIHRKFKVILNGNIIEDKHDITSKLSTKMKALIYHINANCITNNQLKKLIEISFRNYYNNYSTENVNIETEFLIDQSYPIEISKDLFCMIEISRENHLEQKKIYKVHAITATIFSSKMNVYQISKTLSNIEQQYLRFLRNKIHDSIYCFQYTKDDDYGIPQYNTSTFSSTKTFDNLVFQHKNDLKSRIDFFNSNSQFYNKLGIPYTLGMLFYGSPGTGKTSTIKAIANYTKRHIISIPMTKLNKYSSLRRILLDENIGDFTIPHNQRLYIFEEVDCNGMERFIKKRDDHQETMILKDIFSKINDSQTDKVKLIQPKQKQDDEITLGAFLELIDGITEASGRMLIMTTNNDPEKFDDALLRPGRIDIKVEFHKCSQDDIAQLYKLWFDIELSNDIILSLKDNTYSPAELGEIFIRNMNNPRDVLKLITQG